VRIKDHYRGNPLPVEKKHCPPDPPIVRPLVFRMVYQMVELRIELDGVFMKSKPNIALMGMAGVGKSFIGQQIAAISEYETMETDTLIAAQAIQEGTAYNDLSDADFLRIEKDVFTNMGDLSGTVIDMGASVIYDRDIMEKIAGFAHIVYIRDGIDVIESRFNARGPVPLMGIAGKTFEQLFAERQPLYERYAEITVTRNSLRDHDALRIAEEILQLVRDDAGQ
jgi:shikimate kinase